MTTSDEDRWAHAESIVDGAPTDEARRLLRRFRRRVLALFAVVVVVSGIVGGLVGALVAGDSPEPTTDPPWGWAQTLGLVLAAAGLVVMASLLVVQWRSGQLRFFWNSPALVLTRRQRKALAAEIRGRRPADPRHLRVARAVAAHVGGLRQVVVLLVGLLLILLAQALLTPSGGRWVYTGALLLLYGVVLVPVVRNNRQVHRFLAEHPEPRAA